MSEQIAETAAATPKPPVKGDAPKLDAPVAEVFDYPTDTPTAAMTEAQQAEYWREKAQKHEKLWKATDVDPKDLEALREKAKRFEEFEESQKSELQKAADRATAAEAKAVEVELRAVRAEVAAAKGIPAALLSGTTQEELEASAAALIEFRGEQPKPKPADFGGGDRGGDVSDASVKQLTQEDVKRLYADKKYAEIEQARSEGRLKTVLGG